MQILFVHPNFPAQFGPVLSRLARRTDVEPVFVTKVMSGDGPRVRRVRFETRGGATASTHYCSRTFENAVWGAHGVYEACKGVSDLRPDLIVGHSGFGTTLFLRELYDCPIVGLFEYYYHAHGSDLDFRGDQQVSELNLLRSHARNAMILLDLEACAAGYTATAWQRSLLPVAFRPKIEVIHDGIDTTFWRRSEGPRRVGDEEVPSDTRIVTYVSRGLESLRGFDVFVRLAKRILSEMPNVLFVVVGSDRSHYGSDPKSSQGVSFREHVLETERPDMTRFRFLGRVPQSDLVGLLSLSDLHTYLSAPFVLSWSVLNALACECVVLAADTEPVREVIRHGENGLLGDFFDVEDLAARALEVLRNPNDFRAMAERGRSVVEDRYSLDASFPRLWSLYRRAADRAG